MTNPSLLSLTLVVVALAGCAGGAGDAPGALENEPEPAPEAVVEEGSGLGSISGTVQDDEGVPVKNADVAIVEDDAKTKSDAEGKFTFNDLEPGSKKLFVQRLGYESLGKSVTVVADEVASVSLVLVPIPVDDPRYVITEERGYLTCAVGTPVVTVWGGNTAGACENATGETPKRNLLVPVDPGIDQSYSELAWEPWSTAVGTQIRMVGSFEGTDTGEVIGDSPIVLDYKGYDEGDEGSFGHLLWAGWGGANTENPGHTINVMHAQHVTLYFTAFMDMKKPEVFTALPPE